jgi:hypothetical protein
VKHVSTALFIIFEPMVGITKKVGVLLPHRDLLVGTRQRLLHLLAVLHLMCFSTGHQPRLGRDLGAASSAAATATTATAAATAATATTAAAATAAAADDASASAGAAVDADSPIAGGPHAGHIGLRCFRLGCSLRRNRLARCAESPSRLRLAMAAGDLLLAIT